MTQKSQKVILNTSLIESDGCASCHVLFKLVDALSLNESDAGDLLSQVLYENPELNERFKENAIKNSHEGKTYGRSIFD